MTFHDWKNVTENTQKNSTTSHDPWTPVPQQIVVILQNNKQHRTFLSSVNMQCMQRR